MDDSNNPDTCPLCMECMDDMDRRLEPCECGYKICFFCWHKIKEEMNGKCPACRRAFDDEPRVNFVGDSKTKKKERERKHKQKKSREVGTDTIPPPSSSASSRIQSKEPLPSASLPKPLTKTIPILSSSSSSAKTVAKPTPTTTSVVATSYNIMSYDILPHRLHLKDLRVLQRNLVFIVGLHPSVSSEKILLRPEYFGQYGQIRKIAINKNPLMAPHSDLRHASSTAYITFVYDDDAFSCIRAIDGHSLYNHTLRACTGTTKYCSAFLRGLECPKQDCMYLHEEGDSTISYTKDCLQTLAMGLTVDDASGVIKRPKERVVEGNPTQLAKTLTRIVPSGSGVLCESPIFPQPFVLNDSEHASDDKIAAVNSVLIQSTSTSTTGSVMDIGSKPVQAVGITRASTTGSIQTVTAPITVHRSEEALPETPVSNRSKTQQHKVSYVKKPLPISTISASTASESTQTALSSPYEPSPPSSAEGAVRKYSDDLSSMFGPSWLSSSAVGGGASGQSQAAGLTALLPTANALTDVSSSSSSSASSSSSSKFLSMIASSSSDSSSFQPQNSTSIINNNNHLLPTSPVRQPNNNNIPSQQQTVMMQPQQQPFAPYPFYPPTMYLPSMVDPNRQGNPMFTHPFLMMGANGNGGSAQDLMMAQQTAMFGFSSAVGMQIPQQQQVQQQAGQPMVTDTKPQVRQETIPTNDADSRRLLASLINVKLDDGKDQRKR